MQRLGVGMAGMMGMALAAAAAGVGIDVSASRRSRPETDEPKAPPQVERHFDRPAKSKPTFRARTPHHAVASREKGIGHAERMRRRREEQLARKPGQRFS